MHWKYNTLYCALYRFSVFSTYWKYKLILMEIVLSPQKLKLKAKTRFSFWLRKYVNPSKTLPYIMRYLQTNDFPIPFRGIPHVKLRQITLDGCGFSWTSENYFKSSPLLPIFQRFLFDRAPRHLFFMMRSSQIIHLSKMQFFSV